MPSGLIQNTNGSTSTPGNGEVIIPFFAPDGSDEFSFANAYWYMEQGWESIGSTEDEMIFMVKAQNVSNYAFDIVMNPDGPLSTIKFDTPVIGVAYFLDSAGKSGYDVQWAGYVKTIRQVSRSNEQWVQVTCTSVKKKLRDICIRGSYCWDGTQVVYRDAIPLHLNRGGRPDWTFSDDGIPMPAVNPDWGLTDGEVPFDADDLVTDAVFYCTLGTLLTYLRTFYSSETSTSAVEDARDTAREFNTALDILPAGFPFNFIWPESFGAEIDQFVIGNFNNAVGQNNSSIGGARKGRDMRFRQGQPLMGNQFEIGVLDAIFAECGGFSYALAYGAIDDNADGSINITLTTAPTRVFNATQACSLFCAGLSESVLGDRLVCREMDYVESCSGTYTRMIGVGSSVKVETRGDATADFQSKLQGWTDADFEGWKTDSVAAGVTSETLMYQALKKYPHLFSRFLFNPQYPFDATTDYEDYPRALAARPVWPFLLSYQGSDLTDVANDIVPYPVRLEIDTGSGFADAHVEQDGFISWDNGYFEFNAFRDIGINRNDIPSISGRLGMFTWNNGWGNVVDGKLDITLNDFRCTVAIPHDATLNFSVKNPSDAVEQGDESLYELAPDSPDSLRFDSRFTRPMILDLSRLYDLWLRVGSYPIPESAGGTQFADKLTIQDAVRSDYALLQQNVLKSLYERNRLTRSGYFKYIGVLIPPQVYPLGQQVNDMRSIDTTLDVNPFPLNCCIQRKVWRTVNLGSPTNPKWSSSTELVPI